MRGLIIKDILFIKNTWKNLIIMFIGSLMISIALGNYLLAIVVVPVMLLSSSINTFQTDEFYNTESYTLTLPLSRKKIITAKYIFTFIMLIASFFLGLVIFYLVQFIINPGVDGVNLDMIKELIMLELASLFVDAIFYPVIYKFGCEKSKFVMLSLIMLLIGIFAILSVYVNVFNTDAIDFEKIMNSIETYGVQVLSVVVSLSLLISYGLSILFYRKRDF